MDTARGFASLIIILIIAAAVIGGGWWYLSQKNQAPAPTSETASTTQQGPKTVSVPGMSQYTDPDFAFSFWYPSSWTIKQSSISTSTVGNLKYTTKELDISNASKDIHIGIQSGDNADYQSSSNVSEKTMGNLSMIKDPSTNGEHMIVPITQRLTLFLDGDSFSLIPVDYKSFARTIMATDPSVTTPVSVVEQIKVIEAEKAAYAGQ